MMFFLIKENQGDCGCGCGGNKQAQRTVRTPLDLIRNNQRISGWVGDYCNANGVDGTVQMAGGKKVCQPRVSE